MEVITAGELELFKTAPRQLQLPKKGDIQIHGVSQSGKTTLVLQSLEGKDFLYFDLRNEVDFPKIMQHVRRNREISIFVFEIYNLDISKLVLPKKGRKIIISWKKRDLENFQSFRLFPPTFEEFLSFRNSYESIENSFLHFSETGSFPIFARSTDFIFRQNDRILHFALSEFQIDILTDIANNIGVSRSKLNIYASLKERRRISKDRFYRDFSELLEMGYIFVVDEFEKYNSNKFYLLDSALLQTIRERKNFSRLFENLVVSEFGKRGKIGRFFRNIDFFNDEVGYLFLPFLDEDTIDKHLEKNLSSFQSINLKRAVIITMDYEEDRVFEKISVEAIPFVRWATTF
jgi:hypothetical protein